MQIVHLKMIFRNMELEELIFAQIPYRCLIKKLANASIFIAVKR